MPCLAIGQPATYESADPVEAYLVRLGLREHAIEYLEGELRRQPNREALARSLASHHADRLLDATSQLEMDASQRKISDLLARYPALRGPYLDTVVLQADFARAERDFAHWVFHPDDMAARQRAAEIFDRIAPQLRADTLSLQVARQRLESDAEKSRDGPERDAKFKSADRAAQQFGRAAFHAAWAQYYLAQLRNLEPTDEALRQAQAFFKNLIPLENPTPEADPDELGLGSIHRARAVLGLALVEMAMGQVETGTLWLGALRHPAVHEEVRGALDFWQLHALIQAGRADDAVAFANRQVQALGENPPPSQANFYRLLVVQAGHRKGPWSALAEPGLRGLVQGGMVDTARKLADQYHLRMADDSHAGLTLHAFGLLETAGKTTARADFRRAAEAFGKARGLSEQDSAAWVAASYQAGYCQVKAGDWSAAIQSLEPAMPALRLKRPDLAGDASWLLVTAYANQKASDPSLQAKWVQALKEFTRDFPKHNRAGNASAQLATLEESTVTSTPAAGPEILRARMKKAYQQWRALRVDQGQGAEALRAVQSAAGQFLALPDAEAPESHKLEAALILADTCVSGNPQQLARAEKTLATIESLARKLPVESRSASDFHTLRLQLAQAKGDLAMATEAAAWLAQNRPGSPLHEAALVGCAKTADALLAASGKNPQTLANALTAHRELVQFFGENPDIVKANRNARIATLRLAELLYEQGRVDECKNLVEHRLLKAYPREAKYLRLMGLACNDGRSVDQALECWRLLTAGQPSGSPEWYEAKYHHMANLGLKSIGDARLAFGQFKVLHPDMGPEPIRSRFVALEKKLTP